MIAALPSFNVEFVTRLWQSVAALAVVFVVWRLFTAVIDRLFVRRFAGRFIQRAVTYGALFKSTAAALAVIAAIFALLHIWGMDITPEVWSAGIVTAALAFGAQSVVRDVLAGLLFLFEDVYEIGDSVEITTTVNSVVAGTVENLGLRLTVIVDDSGRRFAIPNGNILMVANANKLANSTSFVLTLPLRLRIDELRTKLADMGRAACAEAGIGADALKVYVDDVGLDTAAFRIEIPVARADAASVRCRIRESVTVAAQTLGWLPGAANADAANAHGEAGKA